MDVVATLASQRAVVIFSKSTCCMSHAIKRLFYEQGVSPAIVEIDQNMYGKDIEWALARLGCSPTVPAVFVGGKFVGTANTVMTLHLNGSLKRLLKEAGALLHVGTCIYRVQRLTSPKLTINTKYPSNTKNKTSTY
ncbi:hypothetical protein IGI04_012145 [Brassica rapa subsp. trilocularis]|uniref:Glutaredoxin domain-containing protein n=1 Tax=Brassica rapa subsp. trilocularis TaxID=1813537 RepID=A0ABQ7N781_BRACM|nr:hypothetical protein IGI04_012145 [Brassica rapa subsp. trilocularis]